ncbi:MAG: terminase, partial [Cohaesibacter sp.]|nr:terminase [Cohaesibacter sp.]
MTEGRVDDPEQALIDSAASCEYDPQAWADFAWDWGEGPLEGKAVRAWQRDINQLIARHLQDPERRYQPLMLAVASGHGIGKSAQMGMLANWAMSCFNNCKIVVTANTGDQLTTKTSPEITKWFKTSITSHWFDYASLSIKAKDKDEKDNWRLDFNTWSEHNTEAFAGLHNEGNIILLLMDEASNIADVIWEVAEGALSDENTIIIWVAFGNPTRNSGRFRECFRKYRKYWKTRQIDSRMVEGTNKTFLSQLVEKYGEDSDTAKVRVRGMFPSSAANQYISTDLVDAASKVHLRPEQYDFAPKIIGVDPSWTGEDEFVIYLRQGLYSKLLASYAKNDNDVIMAQHI